MKRQEIEKLLKQEIEDNVPFVLPKVLETPCKIEEVVEKAEVKKSDKPYFQFRFLYASLIICALLVIALGSLPTAKTNSILGSNNSEKYVVTTTVEFGDSVVYLESNQNNVVTKVVIDGLEHPWAKKSSINDSLEYAMTVLKEMGVDTNSYELKVESTNQNNAEAYKGIIADIIEDILE